MNAVFNEKTYSLNYKKLNPFVQIPSIYLQIIRAFLGIKILIGLVDIFCSSSSAAVTASSSELLVLGVRSLPFLIRPTYGLFHPLITPFLVSLLKNLPEVLAKLSALIQGNMEVFGFQLEFNRGLHGWSAIELADLHTEIQLFNLLATFAYFAGYYFFKTKASRFYFTKPKSVQIKSMIIVAISFAVFCFFIDYRGGLEAHILSWAQGRTQAITESGDGIYIPLIQLGLAACLMWFASDRLALLQPWFLGSCVVSISVSFLTNGSRSGIIVPIGLGLAIWMLREKKVAGARLVIFIFAVFVALGLLGNFRRSVYTGEIDWAALTDVPAALERVLGTNDDEAVSSSKQSEGELAKRSGSQSSTYPLFARVPKSVDYLYGRSYLSIPSTLIPRKFWPEKPRAVGRLAGKEFFNTTAGTPPGNVGEAYWNFGLPGIVLVFLLFGMFHKWLAKTYAVAAGQPAAMFLYLLTLTSFTPGSGPIIDWMLTFFPLLAISIFFRFIWFKAPKLEQFNS